MLCRRCKQAIPNGSAVCKHCGAVQKRTGKPRKQLEDMTEPELKALTTDILDSVGRRLPDETAYAVIFWPMGEHTLGHYGSNCERKGMIAALREVADRLERRQDVTR